MRTPKKGPFTDEAADTSPFWNASFLEWAHLSRALHRERSGLHRKRPIASTAAHTGPLIASASGRFHLLHRSADCCRWRPSEDLSISGQSMVGYGSLLGGLSALDQQEGGAPGGPKLRGVPGPAGCEAPCLSTPRCSFYSHSVKERLCVFCSSCTLTSSGRGAAFTAWARNQPVPRGSPFAWAAALPMAGGALAPRTYAAVPATADEFLGAILQGNYSQTLYGAPGRVPLQELRIVWLDLLPKHSLERLSQVGMCKWEAKPPFQPFYFLQDMQSTPLDSMWLSQRPASTPFASHTWVEVTHCPNRRATAERRPVELRPLMNWKFRPSWFYLAPGSGVSVNLGRTVAVRSYDAAVWLLRRIFPYSAPANLTCEQMATLGRRSPDVQADLPLEALSGGATPVYDLEEVIRGDIDLRTIDSIQILSHIEYFSRESKAEIMLLQWAECLELTPDLPEVRCGRYPHFSCEDRAASIGRLARCARFNAKLLRSRVKRHLQTHSRFGRSPCSSSPCYSADERWWCPAA